MLVKVIISLNEPIEFEMNVPELENQGRGYFDHAVQMSAEEAVLGMVKIKWEEIK